MNSLHDRVVLLFSCGLLTLLVVFAASSGLTTISKVPDFARMTNVQIKKDAFFAYLLPQVLQVNSEILLERQSLGCLDDEAATGKINASRIRQLALKYRVPNRDELSDAALCQALVDRISVIPVALALAQAANESAWGTSRFARQQKNYFGLWCFTADCGVKPKAAAAGTRHLSLIHI